MLIAISILCNVLLLAAVIVLSVAFVNEKKTKNEDGNLQAQIPQDEKCPAKIKKGWSFFKPAEIAFPHDQDQEQFSGCSDQTTNRNRHDKINFYFANELYNKFQRGSRKDDLLYFFIEIRFLPPFLDTLNAPMLQIYWEDPILENESNFYLKRNTYKVDESAIQNAESSESIKLAYFQDNFEPSDAYFKLNHHEEHIASGRDDEVDSAELEIKTIAIGTESNRFSYHFVIEKVLYRFSSQNAEQKVKFD